MLLFAESNNLLFPMLTRASCPLPLARRGTFIHRTSVPEKLRCCRRLKRGVIANASMLIPAAAIINPELVFSASSALMVPIYGAMALAPASRMVGSVVLWACA